jgi:serine phosphatase RsbU (regulator of sigma subunit)
VVDLSIAIAVAERPYPGEEASGDAWRVDRDGDTWRIAMIDGLGHGPQAAVAAVAASDALAAHPSMSPDVAIQACHEALKGTRGAALLVIQIDLPTSQLTFAGVGNVEAQIWQRGVTQHLVSDRGIVGSTLPRIRPLTVSLEADWLLLVYTDGIRDRFEIPELQQSAPDRDALAQAILAGWSRKTDDATILVAEPSQRVATPG